MVSGDKIDFFPDLMGAWCGGGAGLNAWSTHAAC
jgi:hypothetical protein